MRDNWWAWRPWQRPALARLQRLTVPFLKKKETFSERNFIFTVILDSHAKSEWKILYVKEVWKDFEIQSSSTLMLKDKSSWPSLLEGVVQKLRWHIFGFFWAIYLPRLTVLGVVHILRRKNFGIFWPLLPVDSLFTEAYLLE